MPEVTPSISSKNPEPEKNTLPAIDLSFQEIKSEAIAELNGKATLLKHTKSGADILILENSDPNKVFCAFFQTPPTDSTGVPHILEHSVLNGSKNFPLKSPFAELKKSSLHTFLNASTYPDMTCYPVASTNDMDFINLSRVYLDAVLNPLLKEETFLQEGWRYEMDKEGKLKRNGTVYNEMKGAYSQPSRQLAESVTGSLFPDTPYQLCSGGDPEVIPQLTYDAFKAFHEEHYHPSNSLIVLYGDIDREKSLALLEERLKEFEAIDTEIDIPDQPPFLEPVKVVDTYNAPEGTDTCYSSINWVLKEYADPVEEVGFAVLDYALLMMPSSPLKIALLDSGLGEKIVLNGLNNSKKQDSFGIGLKGVMKENCLSVIKVIKDTLAELAETGIDSEDIEASLNEIEFQLCENNSSSRPQGFRPMMAAAREWQHGKDPFAGVKYLDQIQGLKERIKLEPEFFQDLIKKHFLTNNHSSEVILMPEFIDSKQSRLLEEKSMQEVLGQMSEQEIQTIKDAQDKLKAYQKIEDSPEVKAMLPVLPLSDIPTEVPLLPFTIAKVADAEVLNLEINTSGIVYANIGFDLSYLPRPLVPYAGIFGKLCTRLGTSKTDYIELNRRISQKTGGISSHTAFLPVIGNSNTAARLILSGKSTADNSEELFSLLKTVTTDINLDNKKRIKQLVLEAKAQNEYAVLPRGHANIVLRLGAHFSSSGVYHDATNGFKQIMFLRELADRLDHDWDNVRAELEVFKDTVLTGTNLLCNLTASEPDIQRSGYFMEQLIQSLPDLQDRTEYTPTPLPATHEAFYAPSEGNYVGKSVKLPMDGIQFSAATKVILEYINNGYFWPKLRDEGGAYGAHALFNQSSGVLAFVTYRDPNLLKTLDVYDSVATHLMNLQLSPAELEKYKMGVLNDLDPHLLPASKSQTVIARHTTGLTDDLRQQVRDQVFGTTLSDFHEFGKKMKCFAAQGHVVILGSKDSADTLEAHLGSVGKTQIL